MLIKTKFKKGQFVFTSKDGAGIITGITIIITNTFKKIEYEIKKTRDSFKNNEVKFIYAFENEVFKSAYKLVDYIDNCKNDYLPNHHKKVEVIYYNLKDSFDYGLFQQKSRIVDQALFLRSVYEDEKN